MQTVPKGSIIFNHEQSEELLKYGHTTGRARASITLGTGGDSFLGGTAHSKDKASFGGKIGGNRDNDKNDGGDTYNNIHTYNNYESESDSKKDSDDSSSEDAKDKVKELFDWIEVKMERLTTRIKVAATTAGSAFESFADRLTANAKQIKTIKIKEEKNDEAVKEYKKASKKARKGLSKKYVKKVRNGTIDIEEIKNEKLKDKITKYQDAYKKYYDAKYVTPGELKQERLEAVSNRFDMVQSKYEGRIGKHDNTIEKYQKNQELREEKGLLPSIKNYKAQIKETDAKKKDLLAEQKALKSQLEKAIQDGIAKDSEKYREMEEAVEAVGIALKDADIDAQKLKNDINKAYLATFEKHNEEGESKTGDLEYEQKKIEDNDALRVAKGKNKSLSNNKALRKNAKDQVKTGKTILKQLRADYKNFLKGGGLPDSDEGKKMIAGIRSWEEEIRSDIQRYVDLGNEALDIVVDDLSDVQDNINFKRLMNDQGRQSRANKQSLREAKGLLPDIKSYKNDLKSNAVDRELDEQEAAALDDAMKKYREQGGKSTDKAYRDMKEQRYNVRRRIEQSLIDDEETKKKIKDWYVDAYTKKSEKYENALSANEYRRKQLQNEQDIRVAKGELESRDNVKEQRALAESDKKIAEKRIGILERLQRMYLQEEGHTVNDEQYKSLGKSIESLNIDVGELDKSIIDFDNDLKRIDVEEHNRKIEDLDYNYDLKNHDLEMLQIEQSKRNAKDLLNSVNNFDAQREIINDMGRIIDEKIQTTIEDMKNYSGSTDDKEYKDFQKELNDLYEARSNNELELLENQNSIKQAYVDKFNRQADRFDANSAKFDHEINILRARQERNNLLDKDEGPEIYNQMIDLTKQKIENEMTRIQKLRETLAEYLANGGSTEDDNYRSMSSGLYSAEEGLETLINSLYELGDAATNTAVQLFNKNKNKYDAQIEGLEFLNSIIDSRQESSDLNGGLPSAELYEQQRENLTKMIDLETQSFEQMKRDMENFIAMGGDTTSDEYMNMLSSLRQMGKSILDRTNELDELGKKIREIPVERLKKITDFYDFLISGNEHEKNTLENEQSLLTAKGKLASVETYEKMIANDNEKLAILAKEREYIVQSMADYLASPGAKETDEEYRDMANQLNELDETAQQTEIDMANLNNEIRSVYTERFNKIAEDFGNQISLIEHKTNEINNTLSLIEARGHFATKSLYDSLVGGSIEQMDKLKAEFDELVIARDEAFESGKIEKYSSEWYAFQNALSDVNERYQEAYLNAVKFRKELEKLNWDKFDFLQNQISDIAEEAQFMIDLLSHKDLFDKEGLITNEGMATIGLYTERYHILTEQLAEYADEIARLDGVIEENPGDKEYIERRQELVKARRDTILTIENEKDSIKSLVDDGIQKELDSLRELIDAYVDAMDSAKDLYDYQKRIKKQTDEIAKLRKRLAAYSSDTSEENKARVQKITVDLEEALDELEETQYEHYISEQKKMLDDLYDQYEKLLNDRLDDVDALLKDMLTMVDSNANQIAETIRAAAVDSKYGITSTINAVWGESIWNSGGEGETIISNISDVVAHGVQETISIVNDIFDSVNNDVLPALHALDKDPVINVEPAKVEVNIPEPDTSKFIDKLQEISDKVSLIVNDASNAKSAPKEEYSFSAHDDGYHAREDVDDKIVEEYVSEEQVASDDYVISLRQKLEDIRKEITDLQNKQWTQKDLTTNKAQTFGGIASLGRQLVSLLDEAVGNKELQREISSLINALDSLRKNVTSQSQSYSATQPGDIVEEYASSEQTASEAPAYSSQTSSITLNTYQVKTDPYGNGSRIDPSYYGHPVFVTDVRSNADYPYQVSSDPYGNNVIGWVRRMHLKGYAGGARLINSDQFAWTQENDPETIVRKSDHAVLTRLGRGDRIYNALASDRLWTAANDPMKYLTDAVGMSGRVNMEPTTGTSVGDVVYNITIPIEHVQDYNDFVNQLRSDGKFEKMVQSMTIDRIAGKSRLAKNKYQW